MNASTNHPRNQTFITLCAVILAAVLLPGAGALASNSQNSPKVAPPQSTAYGKSYDQWEDTYLQWVFGGSTIEPDANGNALVNNVVLIPYLFPAADGSPLSTAVTMSSGQPFMMTMYGFVGWSYVDGTPSDQFLEER